MSCWVRAIVLCLVDWHVRGLLVSIEKLSPSSDLHIIIYFIRCVGIFLALVVRTILFAYVCKNILFKSVAPDGIVRAWRKSYYLTTIIIAIDAHFEWLRGETKRRDTKIGEKIKYTTEIKMMGWRARGSSDINIHIYYIYYVLWIRRGRVPSRQYHHHEGWGNEWLRLRWNVVYPALQDPIVSRVQCMAVIKLMYNYYYNITWYNFYYIKNNTTCRNL